ncbi:flavin-containing monooxygenase [Bacillus sp. AK128]
MNDEKLFNGKKEKQKANVIIIGTGFGGIGTAVRLKQEGLDDFIILERGNDVGGVWRDNQYPGCAVDVESHLYSFSFALNPNWTRVFSPQQEIHAYLKDCVRKFGLEDQMKFQHEVKRMDWNHTKGEWMVHTSKGEFSARFVVGAFGALSDPMIPKLKGIESFKGETFHSATWPKGFNSKGKRVAVIGTGASAIQFIPEIQPDAESLHVFQRTPAWVLPRLDGPISSTKRGIYKKLPILQKAVRLKIYLQRELMVLGFKDPKKMNQTKKIALQHLHDSIEDPVLRQKLTPDYTIGCKRILLSNKYYPALSQPNVHVNTNGISEITEDGIIDSNGNRTEVDTIIYGTGFKVTDLPFAHHIYGKRGHSLATEWKGSPKAYMGTTIAGFPNLFLLQGPNTGLGHSSVVLMMEAQIEHIIKTMEYLKQTKLDIIEPKQMAQQSFVEETNKSMEGTVWTAGGCASWYLDQTGRNSTLWPGHTFSFRKLVAKVNPEDYVTCKASTIGDHEETKAM